VAISLADYAALATEPIRRGIVQKITNESIFLRLLRFIQVDGFTYRYNRQDTLGGIAFRGLNQSYTPDIGVVNPLVESLAIFGGTVDTDRQFVRLQGDRVRANGIMAKVRKAALFFDKYVIDGDPATDPKQFYGLNARLTGNQVKSAGTNGAALTLAMVDELLDLVVGTNSQKVLVMNKVTRRKLTALVVASAGGAAVLDVGRNVKEYNGAPIEEIDEDGDEAAILGEDETQGNSAVTSSIYCVRPGSDADGEYVQGLVGSNMFEHVDYGERGGVVQDLVEALMGIAVFHPRAAARLKGVLPRS
jgi:hypothetical protein